MRARYYNHTIITASLVGLSLGIDLHFYCVNNSISNRPKLTLLSGITRIGEKSGNILHEMKDDCAF